MEYTVNIMQRTVSGTANTISKTTYPSRAAAAKELTKGRAFITRDRDNRIYNVYPMTDGKK